MLVSTYELMQALKVQFQSDLYVEIIPRGEAAYALTRKRRLFCLVREFELDLKLSPSRVEDLLKQKQGRRCRPAPDRTEWEWITVARHDDLLPLVLESYAYVASVEHCGLAHVSQKLPKG